MAKSAEKTPAKTSNAPVFTFRRKGVSVSVFENQTSDGKPFLKATSPQRTYKDDSGEFKTTSSLSRDDICVAVLGLQKAYEFILDAESKYNKSDE